jgi:hypothetical protein
MASFRVWSLMSMDPYMGWIIKNTNRVGKGNKLAFHAHT